MARVQAESMREAESRRVEAGHVAWPPSPPAPLPQAGEGSKTPSPPAPLPQAGEGR
jgi:hypothetical protein